MFFFLVLLRRWQDSAVIMHDCSIPNPFHFITHPTIQHYIWSWYWKHVKELQKRKFAQYLSSKEKKWSVVLSFSVLSWRSKHIAVMDMTFDKFASTHQLLLSMHIGTYLLENHCVHAYTPMLVKSCFLRCDAMFLIFWWLPHCIVSSEMWHHTMWESPKYHYA
jgi:hypothetical protein